MHKKIILAILIIAAIGCCNIVSAANIDVISGTVQNLGEVEYRDYDNKYFNGDVEITFLFSTLDESYMTTERDYDSIGNVTTYKFIANEIEPEWWMDFSEMTSFSYMLDETVNATSNKHIISIGEVFVSYSEVEIPLSPWEENLTILNETYFELIGYYDVLSINYSHYRNLYNSTKQNFDAKVNELGALSIEIAKIREERDIAVGEHDVLNVSLADNITKYNNTYNLLMKAGANVTYYRMFFDGMTGRDSFWFDGVYYTTVNENMNVVQGLKNELGIAPLYTILAFALPGLILFFIFRVFSGKKNPTPVELERDYNYTPESREIDNWVNTWFDKHILRKKDTTQIQSEEKVVPIVPLKQDTETVEQKSEPITEKTTIPEPKVDTSAMKEEIVSAVKKDLEVLIKKAIADAIATPTDKGATTA